MCLRVRACIPVSILISQSAAISWGQCLQTVEVRALTWLVLRSVCLKKAEVTDAGLN